jgi:hypothetical protein
MKLNTKQAILIGLPIAVGLVFIVRHFTKKPKPQEDITPIPDIFSGGGSGSSGGSGGSGSTRNDNFPLKKGSKGDNVRRLQNALLKLNPSALPKYGADGDFGNETEGWLQVQTGKTTCTAQELTQLELKAAQASGTWSPPMALPNNDPYYPSNVPPFSSWIYGNQ